MYYTSLHGLMSGRMRFQERDEDPEMRGGQPRDEGGPGMRRLPRVSYSCRKLDNKQQ